jgi:hypothetical protein
MEKNSQSTTGVQFSLRTLLVGVTVIALLLGIVGYFTQRAAIRRSEPERLAKLDNATITEIVKEVEAIRLKLGRAPQDQEELETFLGKPMPVVHL